MMELPESAIRPTSDGNGVLVSCRVQPGASRSAVLGAYGDAVKIALHSPPVDGRANEELRRLMAQLCGLPRGRVEIRSGLSSRSKQLLLSGIEVKQVKEALTGK